jgi:outer membrane protein OmpA-like peptidoglycan-associated protein
MTPRVLTVLLVVAAFGCATVPKPPELEALEQLRASPEVAAAQKRSPDLVSSSDRLYAQSTKGWQSKDVAESRRDALMSAVKLKTAMALAEQEQSRARIVAADKELAKSEEEYGRLAKELAALNEQILLMQKLTEARQSASEDQQKAAARDKVAAAELAIKTADIVDAATHAKAEYASAKDLLSRAQAELKQGSWSAAQTSAEMARGKAEQAAALAKPLYRTRDEALGRDAAAIPGITVRLERRGDLQRLVLPLHGLFTKNRTTIAPGKDALLDQVAALVKKYPTYPIHVIGHTARGGRLAELLALSLARAQSVSDALVARGVEDRRIKVSGQGAGEPIGVGNVNNRVEIVFIYQ